MISGDQDQPTPPAGGSTLNVTSKSDCNGRKRKRVTLTAFTPEVMTCETGPKDAALSHANDMPSSAPSAWDFLARWEAEDTTIIDEMLDQEEHYSAMSDASADDMEEAVSEADEGKMLPTEDSMTRPSKLGTSRVTEIINECIETYSQAWRPGKDETKHDEGGRGEIPVVYDPIALWEEAEAAGQREELAERFDAEAEYYRQRLDKLCETIFRDPGDTEAGIRMKCRNLEVTVDLLERAEWLALVYKEPPEDITNDGSQEDHHASLQSLTPSTAEPTGAAFPQNLFGRPIDHSTPLGTSDSGNGIVSFSGTCTTRVAMYPSPSMRARAMLGDAPEHASVSTVRRWDWAHLVDTQDRKRIVSKAVYELNVVDREMARQTLQKVGRANLAQQIPAHLDMLLRGDHTRPELWSRELASTVLIKLFLSWWLCGNYFIQDASREHLEELAWCLQNTSPDTKIFCDYLDTILNTTFSTEALSKPTHPSQAEIIEISDDE